MLPHQTFLIKKSKKKQKRQKNYDGKRFCLKKAKKAKKARKIKDNKYLACMYIAFLQYKHN